MHLVTFQMKTQNHNALAAQLPISQSLPHKRLQTFGVSQTCLGANVSFWPGTKSGFYEEFLGLLGALCMRKGAPLVRYLCTSCESLHMFFTKMCPSGGTEYVSFELFLGILRRLGSGEGAPLLRYLCKTHRSLHGKHV